MSTFVLAVHGMVGDVLAQGYPAPEPPPSSDKYLQIVRYLTWFVVLVLPILVIGGVVAVLVIRGRRNRPDRGELRPEVGEQPRRPPPVQQPLIPNHRYPAPGPARSAPDPALPDDIEWGPPDPSVWGRPEQR